MKLLLRRAQKSGLITSKVTFILTVRAELSEEEQANIKRYKLGSGLLYSKEEQPDVDSNWRGVAALIAHRMRNLTVSVNDLANGRQIECKDIMEMLAVQEQIKDAARSFKRVLDAAAAFGGEEVIQLT